MSHYPALKKKTTIFLSSAAALAFAFGAISVEAASKGGQSGGSSHVEGAGHDGGHEGAGGTGGKRRGKSGDIIRHGGGSKSLRDVFRDMVDETDEQAMDHGDSDDSDHGAGKKQGKQPGTTAGRKGGAGGKGGGHAKPTDTAAEEPEDSDRPEWAGIPGKDGKPGRPNTEPGSKKGDLFGDMYVLLRDENGVPELTQLPDGTWVVQPVDADGNPLELDEEGHLVDEEAALEVDLGRLNVGRAPTRVLSVRYEEVLKAINEADEVSVDATGRITYTIDGETKTIDSPLENLALYVELMNTGTLEGVLDTSKFTDELANLVDGSLTADDYADAAAFFAAASDKTSSIAVDQVVYMNLILGVEGTLPDGYVDYSADPFTFVYDREDVYGDVTVDVLVQQSDGSWVATTVNVYDAVFASAEYESESGVDGFAQAADDARAVIEFVHEYEVPTTVAVQ